MGLRKPHKVGIITDSEETDFWWLQGALSSRYFSGIIRKIRPIDVSNIDSKNTLDVMSSCSFYVYICSGYNQETFPAMRHRLGFIFDWRNLIIIIDNLEDSGETEKKRILQENQDCVRYQKNVFLFSKTEKGTNYLNNLLNDVFPGSVRAPRRESFSVYETSTKNHDQQQRRETVHNIRTGGAGEHFSQVINGHRVGIFSRSSDSDFSWLVAMLRSEDFRPNVSDVRSWCISKYTVTEFIQKVRECTFGILYQTKKMKSNTVTSIKYNQELETLYSKLGKQNVAVLIDDLEDSAIREKSHILDTHPLTAQWAGNLLLVSYQDKMRKRLERVMAELEKQLRGSDLIEYEPRTPKSLRIFPTGGDGHQPLAPQTREVKPHRVGIFSRSTEKHYSWLVKMLRSEELSSLVVNVKSCVICNNQEIPKFIDDINQCTFGILYHSKNRGTVNVTDVTDSLYDQELETLHMILGKENVLVIIDDLEDSSDDQKSSLLQEQPSIEERAADLLLVSDDDKMDVKLLRKKTDQLKTLLQGADGSLENQLETTGQDNQKQAESNPSSESSGSVPHMTPKLPTIIKGSASLTSSISTIGIFSTSEESDYFWLMRLLTSKEFGQKNVLCYKVPGNEETLREAIYQINFGIVYHSVKNGNIRLTDVKKAKYQIELEMLYAELGKRKILIVIDDLDEIGYKMKQQILEKQPSLGRLVADIFLFTTSEMKDADHQAQGKHGRKMKKATMDKISLMKKILTRKRD